MLYQNTFSEVVWTWSVGKWKERKTSWRENDARAGLDASVGARPLNKSRDSRFRREFILHSNRGCHLE